MDGGSFAAAADDLLTRFGLQAYAYALEAAVHAARDGESAESETWFEIADAIEQAIAES